MGLKIKQKLMVDGLTRVISHTCPDFYNPCCSACPACSCHLKLKIRTGIKERCTKCNAPFEAHHHRHLTRKGIFHINCYENRKKYKKRTQ